MKKQTLKEFLKTITKSETVLIQDLSVVDVALWAKQVLEQYDSYTYEQKLQIQKSAEAYRKYKQNKEQ